MAPRGLSIHKMKGGGVEFLRGDPPDEVQAPTHMVEQGVAEGWVTREGEQVVHRPGGPPGSPWRRTHTFVHADQVVFHMAGGDVRYRVTHQPDKYHDGKPGTDAVGDPDARIDSFYLLTRED